MNKLLFVVIIFVILVSLVGYKQIDNYLEFMPNKIVFQFTFLGFILNACISMFIFTEFRNTKLLDGPAGPEGETGPKGPVGLYDTCVKCETPPVTLGDKRIEFVKENNLIVPIPQIDDR